MSVPRIPLRPNADRLWQRLSQAQDAAAHERSSGGAPLVKLDAAVVGRAGERRGRGAHRRIGALVIAGGMAIAAAALVSHRMFQGSGDPARAVGFAADGSANGSEKTLVADARADLPLRFADGSTVTLRAGSSGRMRRPTATGVDIVLERGSFEAHVVHADTTLWLVHAGPYRVRVTGTRFDLTWLASNLDVRLYEGAVVIDGAVLGAGVPLRAGQRLTIAAGVVLIEPLGSATTTTAGASGAARAPVDPPGAPDPAAVEVASGGAGLAVAPGVPSAVAGTLVRPGGLAARGSRAAHAGPDSNDEWVALAERGAYGEALSVARRLGWVGLCRRLDAVRLLTLGDVARYSGSRVLARRAFESLVARFPENKLAGDAVFSLGRLAFESHRPDDATRWFHRYVADWPDGPLVEQAAGRLVESAIRAHDREMARNAARAYLARAPRGPQAALAREVLDQPPDGPR